MTSAASNTPNKPAGGDTPASTRRGDAYAVGAAARRCLACGREPAAGELMTAVLVELARRGAGASGAEFQRLDYCPTCWPRSPWAGAAGADDLLDEGQSAAGGDLYGTPAVAIWTVRATVRAKRKRTFVDDTVLLNFFLRLAEEEPPAEAESSAKSADNSDESKIQRRQFRFVLMLILLRHRKLRHEGTERLAAGDGWLVRLMPAMAEAMGTAPEQVYRVVDPRMGDLQVEQVAGQLSQILQEDIDVVG